MLAVASSIKPMSSIVFAVLASTLAVIAARQGQRALGSGWDWYQGLNHADNQPDHKVYGMVWLPSIAGFVFAIWALSRSGSVVNGWLASLVFLSLLGAWYWPVLIFKKHDLRNSFTLACTVWVFAALAAAAAGIFLPVAGYLMLPLLGAITAGGFYNFIVWQLN